MSTQEQIARFIHRCEAQATQNVLAQCAVASLQGSLIVPPTLAAKLQKFAASGFDTISEEDRAAAMKAAALVIAIIIQSESD